jgi:hypothetical protein
VCFERQNNNPFLAGYSNWDSVSLFVWLNTGKINIDSISGNLISLFKFNLVYVFTFYIEMLT